VGRKVVGGVTCDGYKGLVSREGYIEGSHSDTSLLVSRCECIVAGSCNIG
jgi:hypothetical protein